MTQLELDIYPPTPEKPARKDGAAARAGRPALNQALAEIFANGYVLSRKDINDIGQHYGYSESGAGQHISSMSGREAMAEYGIGLTEVFYRGHSLYYNGDIPVDRTDMENTEVHIDEVKNQQSAHRGYPGRSTKRDSMLI